MKPSVIRWSGRRAPPHERVRELVRDDRGEEAEGDQDADEPVQRRAERRARVAAACWLPMNVTTASRNAHANETRTSIPNSRAMGSPPLTGLRRPVRGRRAALRPHRARAARERPGAPPGDPAHREREDDDHDPDADRALHPELLREELDQAVRARVEQVVPAREEDLVEQDERRVEEQEPQRRPPTTVTATITIPVRCEAPPEPRPAAGPRAARNRSARTTAATPRRRRTPKNTPRTSRMCAALALVEDGDAVQGRRRSRAGRRPGRSRIGLVTAASCSVREAGPRLGLRAILGERHPDRVEERQDRQRDDDERGREAGDEGGEGAAEGVHQAPMVAGVRVRTVRAARRRRRYASSSVRACSHQVSIIRSAGGSVPSSAAAAGDPRPERVEVHGEQVVAGPRCRPG